MPSLRYLLLLLLVPHPSYWAETLYSLLPCFVSCDDELGGQFPAIIILCIYDSMLQMEAQDAVEHNFRWSLATLCLISPLAFFKACNVSEVLTGVMGLVVSSTSAPYRQIHFNINDLIGKVSLSFAMCIGRIFVNVSIGADNIFLTIDSFEDSNVDYLSCTEEKYAGDGVGLGVSRQDKVDDPEDVEPSMFSSHIIAGLMLLVSSVTTFIWFFSNFFLAVNSILYFISFRIGQAESVIKSRSKRSAHSPQFPQRLILANMTLLTPLYLLLLMPPPYFFSEAQNFLGDGSLLNAYNAPLSALTAPHSHYFLEFPINHTSNSSGGDQPPSSPRCEDGSPYSFLFRRGTDQHVAKLLVEFEGENGLATSTPWQLLADSNKYAETILPWGSCTGVPQGFISLGANLFGFAGGADGDGDVDIPIFLRSQRRPAEKVWWEQLGAEYSDVRDWSYLFVPHCTPFTSTSHNIQEVFGWVTSQFKSTGAPLDALVTTSGGGRVGGCEPGAESAVRSSSFTALTFATHAALEGILVTAPSKALVVMDGATLFNRDKGVSVVVGDFVFQALSTGHVELAWVASTATAALSDRGLAERLRENDFLQQMENTFQDSFHVHRPLTRDDKAEISCQLYAFSDMSANNDYSNFLWNVVKDMPWARNEEVANEYGNDEESSISDGRLSFLSIFLILLGSYIISWTVYLLIKHCRQRRPDGAALLPTPHDVWFMCLTKFPTTFLFVSVLIPVVLSSIAYGRESHSVSFNLDFASYLDIDTKEERTFKQYKSLLYYQNESLEEERANCELLRSGDEQQNLRDNRGLQSYGTLKGAIEIVFFYENRDGGTVFTPEALESIWQFEKAIMASPAFDGLCHNNEICARFDSLMPYFLSDDGGLVDDIDKVLRLFPGSKSALFKLDKYFSQDNLGSNVTLTNVILNEANVNVSSKRKMLESLHQELWIIDRANKFPEIIISWSNNDMMEVEAKDALEHDFRWSLASLCFIGLMMYVKVRNVFKVFAGVLGIVLSFTSALYWQIHFNFDELTAMHIAGIFVMLGIGADDIFLTIDSFEHTKVHYLTCVDDMHADDGTGTRVFDQVDHPDVLKQRMVSSYKTVGSMLLVSSVTTAICFFSNILSAVISIRDFGSYMGMVVILNYLHVMTILPSAILVYECHIKPLQWKIWPAVWSKNKARQEMREQNSTNIVDIDMGIILSSDSLMHDDGEVGDNRAKSRGDENEGLLPLSESREEKGIEMPTPVNPKYSKSTDEKLRTALYKLGGDETRDPLASSQSPVAGQENGRDTSTPETISYSNEELHHAHSHEIAEERNFLDHIEEMIPLDRYFVQRHASIVYKWRKTIIFASFIVAVILGIFAWLNFSLYTGTIIVFKEKYNLGRVQRVVDKYFPDEAIDKFLEEGADLDAVGNINISADVSGVIDTLNFGAGVSGDGPAPMTRAPITPAPVTRARTFHPTTRPSTRAAITPAPVNRARTSHPTHRPSSHHTSSLPFASSVIIPMSPPTSYPTMSQVLAAPDVTTSSQETETINVYVSISDIGNGNGGGNIPQEGIGNDVASGGNVVGGGGNGMGDSTSSPPLAPSVTTPMLQPTTNPTISLVSTAPNVTTSSPENPALPHPTWSPLAPSVIIPMLPPTTNLTLPPVSGVSNVGLSSQVAETIDVEGGTFDIGNDNGDVSIQQGDIVYGVASGGNSVGGGGNAAGGGGNRVGSKGDGMSRVIGGSVNSDEANTTANAPTITAVSPSSPTATMAGPTTMSPSSSKPTSSPTARLTSSPTWRAPPILTQIIPTTSPSTSKPLVPPTSRPTSSPTPKPKVSPTLRPTAPPSLKLTAPQSYETNCPPGLPCIIASSTGDSKQYVKREYWAISIVWGMMPVRPDPNLWTIRDTDNKGKMEALAGASRNPDYIDPSDPYVQEWLLKLVTLARNDSSLHLDPQPVWIEVLKEFAVHQGLGFPISKNLFIGVVQILKERNKMFRLLIDNSIATAGPGMAGEFLFTSLWVLSESTEESFDKWTNFTKSINEMLPADLPPVYVYSIAFADSLRTMEIVDSTFSSYFFANGLFLLVILFFTGNFLLMLMVMASLILILLCFSGLVFFAFQIQFGPVESLGVSIFVGLSANYLLHIAHSFHASNIKERYVKIQNCIWMVGSPILWSAISTIGGSACLFACRTWLLTELGILICTIIALSLIFSVGFLLALLACIGPLPIVSDDSNLHSCDAIIIFRTMSKYFWKEKSDQEDVHEEV